MATILDAEKQKYNEKYNVMKAEYERFRTDNVQRQGALRYSVFTEEPVNLYSTVSDFIHQAIVVLETSGVQIQGGADRSFVSAVKYIDNLVKHEKQSINIDELISSTPKLSGQGSNRPSGFAFKPEVSLESFWKEIPSRIVIDPRNINQKNLYELKLKGQNVLDTMEKLKSIIDNYV